MGLEWRTAKCRQMFELYDVVGDGSNKNWTKLVKVLLARGTNWVIRTDVMTER